MEFIATNKAPRAIGPYSQATRVNSMIFCSGQLGLDPTTGKMIAGDVESQARQVLKNLAAVLAEAGAGLDHVVKTTVFVADMNDFPVVNQIYADAFGPHRPARATVQVARLPLDAKVEIECIAMAP